jgi:hypothetical protein
LKNNAWDEEDLRVIELYQMTEIRKGTNDPLRPGIIPSPSSKTPAIL